MFNYDEEIEKLDPNIAKSINKIVKDLSRIKKYRTLSISPWKSNLPEILPFIGQKIESEINTYIIGLEIQRQDLKRRERIFEGLIAIKNNIEDGQ